MRGETLIELFNDDGLRFLSHTAQPVSCVFVDPPDNIGLGYNSHSDNMPENDYELWIWQLLTLSTKAAPIVWMSFNAKHTALVGKIIWHFLRAYPDWRDKHCEQVFTFGQHNHNWLGNNHRPLWCLSHKDAVFYPDAVRVQSARQRAGDKRADPRGRVPGDVFDFPRVVGNSKQRRRWHPTQLNEGLLERIILFSTKPGDTILDPCAGTGTTGRVAERHKRNSQLVETDQLYCKHIAEENQLNEIRVGVWRSLPLAA